MGIRELRKLASTLNIKNYSKYRKAELEQLVAEAQAAQAPAEPEEPQAEGGTLVVVSDGQEVPEGLPEDAEVVVVGGGVTPDGASMGRYEIPTAPMRAQRPARRPLFRQPAVAPIIARPKQGRNERCACGSGLKYKKCCMRQQRIAS